MKTFRELVLGESAELAFASGMTTPSAFLS